MAGAGEGSQSQLAELTSVSQGTICKILNGQHDPTDEQRVARVYRQVLGRTPTPEDVKWSLEFMKVSLVASDTGADPAAADADGETPLDVARLRGHVAAVSLIERGRRR